MVKVCKRLPCSLLNFLDNHRGKIVICSTSILIYWMHKIYLYFRIYHAEPESSIGLGPMEIDSRFVLNGAFSLLLGLRIVVSLSSQDMRIYMLRTQATIKEHFQRHCQGKRITTRVLK